MKITAKSIDLNKYENDKLEIITIGLENCLIVKKVVCWGKNQKVVQKTTFCRKKEFKNYWHLQSYLQKLQQKYKYHNLQYENYDITDISYRDWRDNNENI